ncbi:hypothetical protein Moror_4156 [Moniliophthora roreri MCA 2997]|uniref:Uncharacterized protein n=1 Tax=Moniliophthora roreri (strain MCA 2997) TaxID=1381753 RepID=V2XAE0_MONRO|nr:hypothetical protein Moror_4156 [Moniliophthora roreri MCA 2997]
MLIFHNELIPFAPFFNKHSILMDVYIAHLVINMECLGNKLWMNTASGVILSGPSGPSTSGPWSDVVRPIVVPTTVDMLKGDTCIRFFVSFGPSVDHSMLACGPWKARTIYLDDLFLAMAEEHQSKDSDNLNWNSAGFSLMLLQL